MAFLLENIIDVVGHAMKFLGADDQIEMRQVAEKGGAAGLSHAAEKSKDRPGPLFRHPTKQAHLPKRLLVGQVADAASVQQDHVRFGFIFDSLIPMHDKRVRDLFRVALVHLTAIGFNEELRHGRAK